MRRGLGLVGLLAGLTLAGDVCLVATCSAQVEHYVVEPDPKLDEVRAAMSDALATGGVAAAKLRFLELARRLGNGPYLRVWLHSAQEQLGPLQTIELLRTYLAVSPGLTDYDRNGARQWLVDLHWHLTTQEERKSIYWAAVKNGKTAIWEGRHLYLWEALGMAAREGLEEFVPVAESFRGEADRLRTGSGVSLTDQWLWMVRLRTGAKDADDGIRLQVRRLAAMSDEEFSGLMDADQAFKGVVLDTSEALCKAPSSEPCRALCCLAIRQQKHERRRVTQGQPPRTFVDHLGIVNEGPKWLAWLTTVTAPSFADCSEKLLKSPAEP